MCDNDYTYGLPLALIFEEILKPEPERDERDKAAGNKKEDESTS